MVGLIAPRQSGMLEQPGELGTTGKWAVGEAWVQLEDR